MSKKEMKNEMKFMGTNSSSYEESKFVIVPVPHGDNLSWIKGSEKAPKKVIEASCELEHFDLLTLRNINDFKFYTHEKVKYNELEKVSRKIFKDKKIPFFIGGDHSISIPIMKNLNEEITILHLDAHLDMRESYMENKESHASALYEASKNHKIIHLGVRSGCEEDIMNVKKFNNIILNSLDMKLLLENIKGDVYITLDVDVLDPAYMPATGTPEPLGISYGNLLNILVSVCNNKNVIGMDVVELSPREGLHFCDLSVAKLIFTCIIMLGKKSDK